MANSFANLVANLNLNIQDFSSNLRRASQQANQFAANLKGQINGGLVETAKKSKFEFKDVARIVQGIMISKAFYGGLNAIRSCTNAVWEFSQELEYAKMAYTNLFDDTALAEEFINVLQDFAATTPFSFQESEAAAKRLLAYGIQYKNVMYVMQGVLSASAVQNNPQAIESVSRAIGQIYTKGRLMNEEMRQLAEAGIPAYEILAEKLGLTKEQLQNLGDQAIPASTAINALVDGMTERYGDVVAASATTMQGIISNIKDNATMIASGVFEPIYNSVKAVLYEFGQFLFKLREIYALKGLGGVFEAIFPEELHGTLRQFAANLMTLFQAVVRLASAIGTTLKPIAEALLRVFNAFAPILTIMINALAALIRIITENATAMKILTAAIAAATTMWVLFKIKGLAAAAVAGAITLISKALAGLSAILNFVVAHPFWTLMLVLGGTLVGLSGGFGKLSNAISGVFKGLTKIGGVDPDKLLLPSQEERANDLGKFNEALEETGESMDDLADSTGKANKAAKGLLSFDEVFKLNQPDEGTGGGGIEIPEIEIPDLGDFGAGGGLDSDELDFSGFADDYVTKLIKSLKEKILGAGIGAILGGLLGSALGGAKGAKLGMAIGAFAGWFWDEFADKLGLSDSAKVALPIATGLGATIGALMKGPGGAVIGAGIGALVGWIVSEITDGIKTGDWTGVAMPTGIALGAGIGKLVGHPIIGAAIGALVGDIIDQFIKGFTTGEWDFNRISSEIGLGLGAGIGALVGHPVIGAAIGLLVGDIAGQFITGFTTGEWEPQKLGTELGLGIGAAIGMIAGGPAGAAIGAGVGALVGWLGGLIVENWGAISDWVINAGKSIGEWLTKVGEAYTTWATNVETAVNTWCDNTWDAITTWVSDTWQSIGEWVTNVIDSYNTWATIVETAINTWCDNTWNAIVTWVSDTLQSIGDWITDTIDAYNTWATDVEDAINTWCDNTWNAFTDWCNNVGLAISTWITNTWTSFTTWLTNLWNSITTWFSNVWTGLTNWLSNMWNSITTWYNNLWNNITTWLANLWNNVTTWLANIWNSIVTWFSNIVSGVSNWFSNLLSITSRGLSNIWTKVTSWISNLWSEIWSKLTNISSKVSSWWSNLWSGKSANININTNLNNKKNGHATGGVFNREHVANFAEGNKAEAIIPLETESAMQPFVDAVANGLTATLMPLVANINGGQSQMQPLYVGTLIADERSLRELERKMQIIRMQETKRRG